MILSLRFECEIKKYPSPPGSTAQAMTSTHNTMNQLTTLGGGGRTLVAQ